MGDIFMRQLRNNLRLGMPLLRHVVPRDCCTVDRALPFLMELDGPYADVIVERWEKFTGKKAVREQARAGATQQAA